MNIKKQNDFNSMADIYEIAVSREEVLIAGKAIATRVIEMVAEQMAKDILENNYNEIISKISPEAIANMSIAEAGVAINETLHKKLPDKVLEIEKITTQVYKKGLLGGLKRIQ